MKKVLIGAGVVGAVGLGAFGMAGAASLFTATQTGITQSGSAQAGTLKIKVETAMPDPAAVLIPDSLSCLPTGVVACPGGALAFTITNPTDVPLRVQKIEVTGAAAGAPQVTAFVTGPTIGLAGATVTDCSRYVQISTPQVSLAGDPAPGVPKPLIQWPRIAGRSTLEVDGSAYGGLGAGMVHLSPATPSNCQGATISVNLTVTAADAS